MPMKNTAGRTARSGATVTAEDSNAWRRNENGMALRDCQDAAEGGRQRAAAGRRRLDAGPAGPEIGTVVRNSNPRSNPRRRGPAPATRRDRRALATREAILRAAAGVFRRRGYARTGMREVAAAADLSPANLYYYFASKDELLFCCQDRSLDRMLAAVTAIARRRLPAEERLRAVVRAHLALLLDQLDGAAAHLETDALPPALRQRVVAKRDRYEGAVRRIVASGIRDGTFAPCDAALVTRALLGALNWTARWYRPDGPAAPGTVAETYADYLVRGLRT
jgi:AcrR family transcriptional regulator